MKRNKFSLSHYRLLTADMGKLYPIAIFEAIPGDTIQQATTALIRMQPMLAPIMHPLKVRIHHWFVPTRLLWDDFEDFITGNANPEFPTVTGQFAKGSLGDYFGIIGQQEVSALPFRAYNMIYNHFYRDEDLSSEFAVSTASGLDTTTTMQLAPVSWEKDYFTTSRPWTQKGSDINIPISGSNSGTVNFTQSPVRFSGISTATVSGVSGQNLISPASISGSASGLAVGAGNTSSSGFVTASGTSATFDQFSLQGSGISALDLRLAMALQRYEEARAKWGSRYVEYLRYLGVRSSDARLQIPEYLGGGRQILQISEVLNTSGTGVLGDMAGHGITAMRSNRYRKFFEEHGYVISLMSIMPTPMYVEGTNRLWLKRTKEDFFQKELQHIGMQEVRTRELKGTAPNDSVFGYQDRYDEYRRIFSGVSGDFRDTLDFWHLGRSFTQDPVLNHSFITSEPSKRIFAEQTQNEFLIMANHSIQSRRMLSKRARTGLF